MGGACAGGVHAKLTLDVLARTLKVGRLTVVLRWEPILKPKMPNSISGKDINLY